MKSRKRPTNGPNCSCNQDEYISKGSYCPHWESALPCSANPRSDKLKFSAEAERFQTSLTPEEEIIRLEEGSKFAEPEDRLIDDETALLEKLFAAGLAEKKALVVVGRIVAGKTFKELARDLGYRRAEGAFTAYNDAMKWLKQTGYGGKK